MSIVAALVLAGLAVFAPAASADYGFNGLFAAQSGSEPNQMSAPGRAAVEQATGNLFVAESGNNRVQVFAPNGSGTADYLTEFGGGELSAPWGIAIAEVGGQTSVYVADAGNDRVVKYDSDEAATPSFTLDASFSSPAKGSGSGAVGSFKAPLAIDPSTGDLLLADNANKLIQRFEADGDFVSAFNGANGASAFEGPIDLAVNSAGDVYVIDANGDIANAQGTSKALRYSGAGEYKSTLGPVGTHERVATVAVNLEDDSVLVSGDQDNVYEAGPPPYQPLLGLFDSADQVLPAPSLDGGAQYDTVSGLAFADGAPDRFYVVLDVGTYFGSTYGSPQVQTFRELQTPVMTIDPVDPSGVTATEATISGTVDPNGAAADWWFEYARQGTTSWKSTPVSSAGSGEDPVVVGATLSGLQPNLEYVFKLRAENSDGIGSTLTESFTTDEAVPAVYTHRAVMIDEDSAYLRGTVTPYGLASTYYFEWGTDTSYGSRLPAAGSTSVGNGDDPVLVSREAVGLRPSTTYHFRIVAENAQGVVPGPDMTFTTETGNEPEYRYEMVSPQEKNGGYVAIEPTFRQGTGSITDDGESVMFTSKTAFGGQDGNAITNTYRALRATPTWTIEGLTPPVIGSLLFGSPSQGRLARVAEDHSAIAVETRADPETKARQPRWNLYFRELPGGPYVQLTPDALSGEQSYDFRVTGASTDLSQLIFATSAQLLPEAPEAGTKLYAVETATGELTLASVTGGTPGTPVTLRPNQLHSVFRPNLNLLSGNGRRVFFEDESGALWMRDLVAGQSFALPGEYLEATPTGRYVFVSATGQLVPADTNGNTDLYRLDLDAAPDFDPVLVSADAEAADGTDGGLVGIAGSSKDGSAVYFSMSDEQLLAGGPLDPARGKFYSWQDGELSYVGDFESGVLAHYFTSNAPLRPVLSQLSPDGSAIAFQTSGSIIDEIEYDRSFDVGQIYLYDADESTPLEPDVACVSCLPPPNETPVGSPSVKIEPSFGTGLGASGDGGMFLVQDNHFLTDDAQVFFETEVPLVPEDVNGFKNDVYSYHEGETELISSGRSAIKSVLFGITPDASSVLFATADQFSGWDEDGQIDAYVARLGDVLPGPPPRQPGCQGDGCLAPPTTPDSPTPASSTFRGAGNEKQVGKKPGKKRCPKGKVRKGGKCVKKGKAGKRSAGKNRAKHDRRASK